MEKKSDFEEWCKETVNEQTAGKYWKDLNKYIKLKNGKSIADIKKYNELIKYLGLKPGEKLREYDISKYESKFDFEKMRTGLNARFFYKDPTKDVYFITVVNKYIEYLKDNNKNEGVEGMGISTDKTKYCGIVKQSKNVILRGAPGTGKTYLAKQIAANLISDGRTDKIEELTENEQNQIGFVQFHPSYDYTDFVEGLRPRLNEDGTMSFRLEDGIFKKFVKRAQNNIKNANKSEEDIKSQKLALDILNQYFNELEENDEGLTTVRGKTFFITNITDESISISIPNNPNIKSLELNKDNLLDMLMSGQKFEKVKDVVTFFKSSRQHVDSYYLAIFNDLKSKNISADDVKVVRESSKPFVFIIDEINRGEISKIFGELFFSIDPGYRGEKGGILTQYANLHKNPNEKFYIPENVYIIGTMNDIDRSVDTFDFAMRRRFRFIEIKADDNIEMLEGIDSEAKYRMKNLNKAISEIEGLNANYHIGPSYFLKLNDLESNYDELWTDYLLPLLQDYVRGMYDEKGILEKFEAAYKLKSNERTENENDEN